MRRRRGVREIESEREEERSERGRREREERRRRKGMREREEE